MKESALPTPGVGSRSQHLRRIAATAISSLEVVAGKYTGARHPAAAGLKTFFDACSTAAAELDKITPTLTFTTAGNATTLAALATLATTLGKGGSNGAASYATSNAAVATVNGAGVITGVAAGTVTITATVAGTSTYRVKTISVTITVTA